MRIVLALIISAFMTAALAQQNQPTEDKPVDKPKATASKEKKKEPGTPAPAPDKAAEKSAEPAKQDGEATDKEEHYDVTEVAPIVTHHQLAINGKTLSYTATTGRLPLKRDDGKIEAEMFFVAYTLD